MTTRRRLAWAPLLLCLTACRDREAQVLLNREAEFRRKEACFASGTKFFHEFVEKTGAELTETFYSQKRNSCICEVRRFSPIRSVSFELHDCLSIERLAESSPAGGSFYKGAMDEWKRQKDALK